MSSDQAKVNLESPSTTEAEIQKAYKISKYEMLILFTVTQFVYIGDAQATLQYNQLSQHLLVHSYMQCADGPTYNYYHQQYYFFLPPILYRSCSGMACQHSKRCAPIHTCVNYWWAVVYKCNKLGCHYIGVRYIRYTEHLDCHCKCDKYQCCPPLFRFDSNVCNCTKPNFFGGFEWNCLSKTLTDLY